MELQLPEIGWRGSDRRRVWSLSDDGMKKTQSNRMGICDRIEVEVQKWGKGLHGKK